MPKKVKQNAYRGFIGFLVTPILFVNLFVIWKLYRSAGHWAFTVIPYSLDEKLTYLAMLLLLNSLALVVLVLYVRFARS
ncbi:MAG: hypothetical protein A2020_07115 [Lentisphaerae bacterium GWF2_45_14]|nr:MAG: hypothetical protein A2020_07115 [Lentisphaerae bacterium GWF2_45_14]